MLFELENLVKQYGPRKILDIDHLALAPRKIYALIGPNGAGKTTLLNHLAFLERPSSGRLFFRNQPVGYERSELTQLRRQVVLVDQIPILFSGTVWRNVEFGLKVRGVPRPERTPRIERALERVGMSAFARSEVYGLSGGEVKRVALARALAVEPEVMLCDEPTANVDQENQEIILKIIAHANSVRNTSVIFSTHYLSQSRRLAHQTLLLQTGRLAEHLEENIFPGRLLAGAGGRAVFRLADRYNLDVSPAPAGALPRRGPAQVHINPGKISLRACSEQQPQGIVGVVEALSRENGRIRVTIDIGVPLKVLMGAQRFAESGVQVCQRVEVGLAEGAVVLVD